MSEPHMVLLGVDTSAGTSPDTSMQEGDWKHKSCYKKPSFIKNKKKKLKKKACRNADNS